MAKDKYTFKGIGLTGKEKKEGRKRFHAYLEAFPHLARKLASQQAVEELVWAEVIQERYKMQVGSNDSQSISFTLQKSIQDGLNLIIEMKDKLGLFVVAPPMEPFDRLQGIFRKGDDYREKHVDDYTVVCPHCQKKTVLMIPTKGYDTVITPFFEDKVIRNRPLFNLYKDGVVTKEEAAHVLGVSAHYIDWLGKKYYGMGTLKNANEQPPDPNPEIGPATAPESP